MADDVFFLSGSTPETLAWYQYYWNIFKRFGAESWSTWRFEMFASLVIGFCSFLYAQAMLGDQGAWDTFKIIFLSTASGLGLMGIWHLIRAPWLLERDKEKTERERFSSGIFGLLLFTGIVIGGAWGLVHLYRADQSLRVENRRLAKDNEELKNRPAEVKLVTLETPKESPNSLRRRTIKLAEELSAFEEDWSSHHPPVATPPPPNEPPPDEERQKAIKKYQDFQAAIQRRYREKYMDRITGIVREYNGKGIHTGWLENQAKNWFPYPVVGSIGENTCSDLVWELKELYYHIDGYDVPIHP